MVMSWRYSIVGDRHRALGSNLEDWNGMGMAWSYDHDINDAARLVRKSADVVVVSRLKKLHVVCPQSHALL